MPGSFPPFVLFDNVFDRINQYPAAVLGVDSTSPGRGVSRVADYRRERTYYSPAANGLKIEADLGVGNVAQVDTIFIDRGHNLWGHSITSFSQISSVLGGGAAVTYNFNGRVVPALVGGQFVPGGDPTVGWCVTEEGAIYTIFPAQAAARYHSIYSADAWIPIVTGLIMGMRTQLDSYSRQLDEDAGGRKRNTDESDAGYTAGSRVYPFRNLVLELGVIGATEYDGKIRLLRRALFEKQIPAFVVMNYGRWAERGWLYILDSDRWSFPTNGVHRAGSIPLRELYPLIR